MLHCTAHSRTKATSGTTEASVLHCTYTHEPQNCTDVLREV